ncbi:hypothetical protein [Acinetobacter junii]|uniref:hypothetical protein n=1 Tax=Acinetobacter junii TaxID=40215 RepID=UPI003EE38DD0
MAERIIQTADLSNINRSLSALGNSLDQISGQIDVVDQNLNATQQDLVNLWQEFRDFVAADVRAKEISLAETRQVKIRQELDTSYGHYGQVRRIATGILQAADIKIVRQETMRNATEELMLLTPKYWLAPALVALGAWLNDNKDLAQKALSEALKRDDEKTTLFFALVSRRAQRLAACQTWLDRYLGQQDPFNLDRQTVVLVDALVNGVFGASVRMQCSSRIEQWVTELEAQAGFVEEQRSQWEDAIKTKYPNQDFSKNYPRLYKAVPSSDWQQISESLNHTQIHSILHKYFSDIFEGEIKPSPSLNDEVDLLLDKLVQNFDDEELPLRQQEHLCQLIIDEMGDRSVAEEKYRLEEKTLSDMVSFTQLLTNAAMHPQLSHASVATQRYAIALSKQWIVDAHQDLTASIRAEFPQKLTLNLAECNWTGETNNGSNEALLLQDLERHIEAQKQQAIANVKLQMPTYIKAVIGGALILLTGFAVWAIVIGAALLWWAFMDYKNLDNQKKNVAQHYEYLKEQSANELKAILAEVVDMRKQLMHQDSESSLVSDFFNELSSKEYLMSAHDKGRNLMAG